MSRSAQFGNYKREVCVDKNRLEIPITLEENLKYDGEKELYGVGLKPEESEGGGGVSPRDGGGGKKSPRDGGGKKSPRDKDKDLEESAQGGVEVQAGMVCVQWYSCDDENDSVEKGNPNNNTGDLHPMSKLLMLVGCGEDGGDNKLSGSFGPDKGPLLVVKGEVYCEKRVVRGMKNRASEMRNALEHFHILKDSDNEEAPLGLQTRFVDFVKDMVKLLTGGKEITGGGEGGAGGAGDLGLLDSKGDLYDLPVTIESLVLLENFFNQDFGCCRQSYEFAYLLRDSFGGEKVN